MSERLRRDFIPHSAEGWLAVGDDYLRPHDPSSATQSGLCFLVDFWSEEEGLVEEGLVDLFRPAHRDIGEYWWGGALRGSPTSRVAREQRAWACYFIAAMMDEEAER